MVECVFCGPVELKSQRNKLSVQEDYGNTISTCSGATALGRLFVGAEYSARGFTVRSSRAWTTWGVCSVSAFDAAGLITLSGEPGTDLISEVECKIWHAN